MEFWPCNNVAPAAALAAQKQEKTYYEKEKAEKERGGSKKGNQKS